MDSLEDYRSYFQSLNKVDECPSYLCGFRHSIYDAQYIEVLSYEEYIKTRGHENCTIEDLAYLILHEFVHACQKKYTKEKCYFWLSEGCATTISHQYEKYTKVFRGTLEQIKNGETSYQNYYSMF